MQQQQQHAPMQTTTTPMTNPTTQPTQSTQSTQPTQTVKEEYDFENDDDSFYDFIEFGIASNGGRLSIRGANPGQCTPHFKPFYILETYHLRENHINNYGFFFFSQSVTRHIPPPHFIMHLLPCSARLDYIL
jgi:hypothetical protein